MIKNYNEILKFVKVNNRFIGIPPSLGVGVTSVCLHEAFRRRQVAVNREDFGVSSVER